MDLCRSLSRNSTRRKNYRRKGSDAVRENIAFTNITVGAGTMKNNFPKYANVFCRRNINSLTLHCLI